MQLNNGILWTITKVNTANAEPLIIQKRSNNADTGSILNATGDSLMLEWFTEDAFFPCCVGILLAITFIGLAFSSGEMIMMKVGLGLVALTAMLIATEVYIITDREDIENSLHDMADAMQQNDFEKVFKYLATEELVARAKRHLRDATCHSCRITAVNEVSVSDDGNSAKADFVAFAQASNSQFPNPVPLQRRIKLDFKKNLKTDTWQIVDFETSDPRVGVNL